MSGRGHAAKVALPLAVLVASGAGCASTIAGAAGLKADQVGPVADARASGEGVCAFADTSGFLSGTSGVKACARTVGQGDPSLVSEFTASDGARWNPGNWHLVVTGADGRVLLDRTLPMLEQKASTPGRMSCFLTTCAVVGRSSERLSQPWRPGTYWLHYTYVPDRKPVDLWITLQ